ncbi:MAG TPA: glutathione ABC transporter permease GsiC, partial [Deinococcales bacterium]|nr:glutathione ABC transporter permease GsiC [Deinococcales bacterium]
MFSYVLRRLVQAIPVIIGVSLITFILMIMVPGDPVQKLLGQRASPEAVAELRRNMGLDAPYWQQYVT